MSYFDTVVSFINFNNYRDETTRHVNFNIIKGRNEPSDPLGPPVVLDCCLIQIIGHPQRLRESVLRNDASRNAES